MGGFSERIDSFFRVSERGSTIGTEIKAGVVTFLTMSYILLVNPQILGTAGLPVQEVVSATALSSTVASLAVGLFANLPLGMSPGMGLNAYLVFSQVLGLGVGVDTALAGCAIAALAVGILAVVRALVLILALVPDSIKLATVVGMGLLLSFIGLQTAKIVVPDAETLVTMGDLMAVEALLAIGGLALIGSLHFRNVKGSIIIGVLATAIAYFAIKGPWPTHFLALPKFAWRALDYSQLIGAGASTPAWSAVLAYSLVMVFDIGGALFGLGNLAGLVDNGTVPGSIVVYVAGALSTLVGAYMGTTPLIIAAESAVGIKEGGRTGLVAITISGCFALSMFAAPFLQSIPQVATAPVLVLVGAMMMGESTHINWQLMTTALPAFLTIVIQPFTFSIANGIYAGLAMSLLMFVLTGNFVGYFRGAWAAVKASSEEIKGEGDLEETLLPGGSGVGADGLDIPSSTAPRSMPSHSRATPRGIVSALSESIRDHARYTSSSFTMLVNTSGAQNLGGSLQGAGGSSSLLARESFLAGGTPPAAEER